MACSVAVGAKIGDRRLKGSGKALPDNCCEEKTGQGTRRVEVKRYSTEGNDEEGKHIFEKMEEEVLFF